MLPAGFLSLPLCLVYNGKVVVIAVTVAVVEVQRVAVLAVVVAVSVIEFSEGQADARNLCHRYTAILIEYLNLAPCALPVARESCNLLEYLFACHNFFFLCLMSGG